MANLQVTCADRHHVSGDPHEGITALGGSGWRMSRQEIITAIEVGTHTFFTLVNGSRAVVGVVHGPNGKYVRTHADGRPNDNLLALTRCTT